VLAAKNFIPATFRRPDAADRQLTETDTIGQLSLLKNKFRLQVSRRFQHLKNTA